MENIAPNRKIKTREGRKKKSRELILNKNLNSQILEKGTSLFKMQLKKVAGKLVQSKKLDWRIVNIVCARAPEERVAA